MFGISKFSVAFSLLTLLSHAHLNPPTSLKADWMDPITIHVSWKKPEIVPHNNCTIKYEIKLNGTQFRLIRQTHFLEVLLTESATKWLFSVQTFSPCTGQKSTREEIAVEAPKPQAVTTDFKCLMSKSDLNCSWTFDPSSPVSVFYRDCGTTPELLKKGFHKCDRMFTNGHRGFCHLRGNSLQKDLCMVVNTTSRLSTFRAPKAINLPNMTISEEGTNLLLTLTPLAEQTPCSYHNICYSVCDGSWICQKYSSEKEKIPYDKSCQYKFQYRSQTSNFCTQIYSDWSDIVTYGSTDWTLTVVAIVIPIFVAACVILSCICFRRHKDIICPDVPDPSTIFKEMINNNKEIKPNVSIYTPVQEPIEPIVIVPHIPHSSGPVST